MEERLQKIIAAAGITSRRSAEQLILDGRVRVNGKVVTELGSKADPAKDHIKVDGKLINPRQPMTYIMLNKPAGYVTTMSDPEGRPTVLDLLKGLKTRVYPVGRLDYNTEGLLLLTNDGDFAHLITHPKHELPKTYRVKAKGVLEEEDIARLEEGVYLDDGKTAPAKIKKVSKEEANSWLDITIHEGRKRQVRRMFDRVGHSVIRLKRVKTGNLVLGDLAEGTFRHLTPAEVSALKETAVREQAIEAPAPRKMAVSTERTSPSRATKTRRDDARPSAGRPGSGARRTSISRTTGRSGPMREASKRRTDAGERAAGQGALGKGPRRPPRKDTRGQAPTSRDQKPKAWSKDRDPNKERTGRREGFAGPKRNDMRPFGPGKKVRRHGQKKTASGRMHE